MPSAADCNQFMSYCNVWNARSFIQSFVLERLTGVYWQITVTFSEYFERHPPQRFIYDTISAAADMMSALAAWVDCSSIPVHTYDLVQNQQPELRAEPYTCFRYVFPSTAAVKRVEHSKLT